MAKIQVTEFKGIQPKHAKDKLPPNMAQIASDLKSASGDIKAYQRSTANVALADSSYKSLFQYTENDIKNWVYYDLIVHWVRSPTVLDTFERMYMTGADSANGKYKAFSNDIQGEDDFDFTTDFYYPGAPSGTKPAIVPDASAGDYVAYFYTYVSRYGEEGPPSAVGESVAATDDGRNDVNGIQTVPAADDHLDTIIDGNIPKVYLYRTVDDGAGSAAFLFILEAEWFITSDTYAVGEYVVYNNDIWECTVQHTGAWNASNFNKGENVLDADAGSVCTSIFYDRAPADLTNLRGHSGGFFVASKGNVLYFSEPFAPSAWPEDYQIPIDQEIIGLGVYGSTIVVATDGHIYTFSGPHPTSLYKAKLSFQPCLSQRAVVESHEGVIFPSKEGFQHVTGGGVVNITSEMFKPEDWVDFEVETMHGTWYNKAYYGFYKSVDHEGYIILDMLNGTITTGVDYHHAGYVTIANGTFHTIYFSDIETPTVLNISTWDANTTEYRMYNYKSPQYIMPRPVNFKVAQVILDKESYEEVLSLVSGNQVLEDLNATAWELPLRGAFNANMLNEQDINGDTLYTLRNLGIQKYVNFKIYVDGDLKWVKQISSSNIFKLPGGFKHKKWEWSVDGMISVKRVTLATSTEEIV